MAFDGISLRAVSVSYISLVCALVWIYVRPQIVHFCFNVKRFMEWLWKSLLFCLLFPNPEWSGFGKGRQNLRRDTVMKVDTFAINADTVKAVVLSRYSISGMHFQASVFHLVIYFLDLIFICSCLRLR